MAKKKATSSDVAARAGVSQATVSMVLNRKYNVSFSRETVERVEQAARELGYELPGRRKHKDDRKEKLIVVFCPTLTSPYYVLLLQGIEAVANEQGYGVFICNTQRDAGLEEKYLRMMQTMRPAGIIYTCNPHPDFQHQVEKIAKETPLVIISNKEKTTTVDAINQDNTVVGRLMARHLLDLGHTDVAFITPPLTRRQWQRSKRVEGFVREFEKEGKKDHVIIKAADESNDRKIPKYPSVSYEIADQIQQVTGSEVRITVPGHMQRGGEPCAYDRVLSTRIGAGAAQAIMDEEYGVMIGVINGKIKRVPLAECAGKLKMVSPKDQLVKAAKQIGISFGD